MKLKSFKKFLKEQELKASKRIGIDHISTLKPIEFISLCQYFKNDLKGILSQENTNVSLKLDGAGLRIGLNSNQKFFIESSNSGPQFTPGSFSSYTKQKTGSSNAISDSYDDVLSKLKSHKPLQNLLKEIFPNGGKLFCELLYTPNAKEIEDKLQFLVVKYDKAKLGKLFTLVFFKAESLGEEKINIKDILPKLKSLSTSDILFEDPEVDFDSIDVNYEVNNFLNLIDDFKDIETILKSRKASDKQTKDAILEIISQSQKDISSKIINTKFKEKFGKEMEGVVLVFNNGKIVKVVSDLYKKGKEEFNKEYKK